MQHNGVRADCAERFGRHVVMAIFVMAYSSEWKTTTPVALVARLVLAARTRRGARLPIAVTGAVSGRSRRLLRVWFALAGCECERGPCVFLDFNHNRAGVWH